VLMGVFMIMLVDLVFVVSGRVFFDVFSAHFYASVCISA